MSECHDQHEMLGGAIARRRLLAAGVARYRYHVVLGKKNTTVMPPGLRAVRVVGHDCFK